MGKEFIGEDGILGENGYISCEIDENEILGNNNVIYWIFGIIDRNKKQEYFVF